MAQSSPKMHQNTLIRVSNLKIFLGPRTPYGRVPSPHPYPPPPPRQRCVEGAEAPCYIALTATQFHSPSTSKFGENPANPWSQAWHKINAMNSLSTFCVTLLSFCSSLIKAVCTPIQVGDLARYCISELNIDVVKAQLVNKTRLRNMDHDAKRTEKLRTFMRLLAVKLKYLFLFTNLKWHPAVFSLNLSI